MSLLLLGASGADHSAARYAVSNSTGLPYYIDSATTDNVHHSFLPVHVATACTRLYLTYYGYYVADGYTVAAGYDAPLRVGVRQANGTWKRAYSKSTGSPTGLVPNDGVGTMYVDGTFAAGDEILICTRIVGPASSTEYLLSHPAVARRGGGRVRGTDTGVDMTGGAGVGFGATGTPTMSAQTITAVSAATPGSGYSGTGSIFFVANEAGGKDANYAAVVDAGAYTGGYQNAVGSDFVTPPITIVANGFASDTVIYGPSIISGVPVGGVEPISLEALGDSGDRGFTSSDQYGDAKGNFGPVERYYNSAFGIVNFAVSGMSAAGWAGVRAKVYEGVEDNGVQFNNTYDGLGINDATVGTSFSDIADLKKTITDYSRARGCKIFFSDWEPATTGTYTGDPSANQTAISGAGAVSARTTHNAELGSDARLTGDYAHATIGSIVQDATYGWAWNGSAGMAYSDDGRHTRSGSGSPAAKTGTTYNFFPTRAMEYVVANATFPTLTV